MRKASGINMEVFKALVNVHEVTREICQLEKVGSFFKCSKKGKLAIAEYCLSDLETLTPEDDYEQFMVAGYIKGMMVSNFVTGKFEVLEAIPALLFHLEEVMYEHSRKVEGEDYLTSMSMMAETRRKIEMWNQIVQHYERGSAILENK